MSEAGYVWSGTDADRMVDRVVDAVPAADFGGMAMMLYGLLRPGVDQFDALAVQPGLGEWWRVRGAIRDWDAHSGPQGPRHLLITGINPNEKTW